MKRTSTGYYDHERGKKRGIPLNEIMQAEAQHMPIEITSYKQALEWWNRRKNIWTAQANGDRPVGKDTDYTRRMRMRADKSIAFDYANHELIAWHPDDTITVDPWYGYRNGAFDRFVMPRIVEVGSGPRSGKVIFLRTADNTDKYDRIVVEGINGTRYVTNPETLVVRADSPVTLHRGEDGRWVPINEMRCKPFYWYELDKGRLREASKKYNIPEFLHAIETALLMGAEIETNKGYAFSATSAGGEDILDLLEQERYVEAAALVRSTDDRHYDSTTGKWVYEKKGLNHGDVKAIRHRAYAEMGLIYLESERIVTLPQFNNIERKLLDFGVPQE